MTPRINFPIIRESDCTDDVMTILVHDEGFSRVPYKDSLGNWTIGVGRLIGQNLSDMQISRNVSMEMLKEDVTQAVMDAEKVFGEDFCKSIEPARRATILCLLFNMGLGNEQRGFLSFKKMIEAIKKRDWDTAAAELEDSNWAKQVDPHPHTNEFGRDDRLVYMLHTGEYYKGYNI